MGTYSSVIKKLVYAKYIYYKAVSEIAIGTKLSANVGLMLLQDSIEMVVIGIEKHLNIDNPSNNFHKRINKIKENDVEIHNTDEILKINEMRRSFKHDGTLQDHGSIKEQLIFAFHFIKQIAENISGLDFEKISLGSLVEDTNIKKHLFDAEKYIEKDDFNNSIMSSGIAFGFCEKLMKKHLSRIHFFNHSADWDWSNNELEEKLDSNLLTKIQESFEEIYSLQSLAIIGVVYQKYMSFKLLTPDVNISISDKVFTNKSGQFENEHNKTCHNTQTT